LVCNRRLIRQSHAPCASTLTSLPSWKQHTFAEHHHVRHCPTGGDRLVYDL